MKTEKINQESKKNQSRKQKKLCIVTGLHGNEAFLFEPLKEHLNSLENKENQVEILLILANELAYLKNVRYIDQDLNRSFGNITIHPVNHEERLAKELLKIVKGDIIIDFHSHSGVETFSIVSRENSKELEKFISVLEIDNCLIINPSLTNKAGIIENTKNSLSIETGKHNSKEAIEFAKRCIDIALQFMNNDIKLPKRKKTFLEAEEFIINKSNNEIKVNSDIKNFVKIKKGQKITEDYIAQEDFIPTLISYNVAPGKKIMLKCKERSK